MICSGIWAIYSKRKLENTTGTPTRPTMDLWSGTQHVGTAFAIVETVLSRFSQR